MSGQCPHSSATALEHLRPPSASTVVYREECTQCFDDQDTQGGVDVCLHCFNGGCSPVDGPSHAALHARLHSHPLSVRLCRRVRKEAGAIGEDRVEDSPPPHKITKLAIDPMANEPSYEYDTLVHCQLCPDVIVDGTNVKIQDVVKGILASLDASQKTEVKAWEEEIGTCSHVDDLAQEDITPGQGKDKHSLESCGQCDLKENLWICLHCGELGCGRQQYGGIGGNGHALEHYKATGHMVACKLGTITPDGTADTYCYACDDERVDKKLQEHLAPFGILISDQIKTERSMAELQLEQNLKFDFSMETSDGKELTPVSGPGLTGMKNLGNSCYLASVMQSIFHTDGYRRSFYHDPSTYSPHVEGCRSDNPAKCWECQMEKLAGGLLSGRYTKDLNDPKSTSRGGISPFMFKSLVGQGHEEFSTMRQQDAAEFFQYIIQMTEKKARATSASGREDPSKDFTFKTEQRLECLECHGVRYTTDTTSLLQIPVPKRKKDEGYEEVSLVECLDAFVAPEALEGWICPRCEKPTSLFKSTRFKTFPRDLALVFQRFEVENWVPKKLAIPISFPDGNVILSLEGYRAHGPQDGEDLLPEEATGSTEAATADGHVFDAASIEQLTAMGFPLVRCQRALIATGHSGPDMAMNWLFEHMEDPDIDEPLPTGAAGPQDIINPDLIANVTDMGFTASQAERALRETDSNMERAIDWLFSHPEESMDNYQVATETGDDRSVSLMEDDPALGNYSPASLISHRGTSMHCGHYVVNIHVDGRWILMNDERVVLADALPKADVYFVLLKRV